jgi:hypothetical protein
MLKNARFRPENMADCEIQIAINTHVKELIGQSSPGFVILEYR